MSSEAIVSFEKVNKWFGQFHVLRDIDLQVRKGERIVICGPSGSGKSTLIRCINRLEEHQQGRITVAGIELGEDVRAIDQVRKQVGMVFQPFNLFPHLTVLENLKMGAFFASNEEIEQGIAYVFGLFPRLKERAAQRAGTMSGGEQQMLAIGRALMSKPRLLLLDEPTLGPAPLVIAQIFEIIRTIRDSGVTVFLVEQNANKALGVADRGYVLENGHVVMSDTGANLLANSDVRKAYLGHG